MKKLIPTLILASCAIFICIICLSYVCIASNNAVEISKQITYEMDKKDFIAAKTKASELQKYWQTHYPYLSMILHHDLLENIDENMDLLYTSSKYIDEEPLDFEIASTSLTAELRNLKECELPSIQNII